MNAARTFYDACRGSAARQTSKRAMDLFTRIYRAALGASVRSGLIVRDGKRTTTTNDTRRIMDQAICNSIFKHALSQPFVNFAMLAGAYDSSQIERTSPWKP